LRGRRAGAPVVILDRGRRFDAVRRQVVAPTQGESDRQACYQRDQHPQHHVLGQVEGRYDDIRDLDDHEGSDGVAGSDPEDLASLQLDK
jgi:hypothetical protein